MSVLTLLHKSTVCVCRQWHCALFHTQAFVSIFPFCSCHINLWFEITDSQSQKDTWTILRAWEGESQNYNNYVPYILECVLDSLGFQTCKTRAIRVLHIQYDNDLANASLICKCRIFFKRFSKFRFSYLIIISFSPSIV